MNRARRNARYLNVGTFLVPGSDEHLSIMDRLPNHSAVVPMPENRVSLEQARMRLALIDNLIDA